MSTSIIEQANAAEAAAANRGWARYAEIIAADAAGTADKKAVDDLIRLRRELGVTPEESKQHVESVRTVNAATAKIIGDEEITRLEAKLQAESTEKDRIDAEYRVNKEAAYRKVDDAITVLRDARRYGTVATKKIVDQEHQRHPRAFGISPESVSSQGQALSTKAIGLPILERVS